MKTKANFLELIWIPSQIPYIETGVKNGKTPKNAIKGSNGTFVIAEPPQLILVLSLDKTGLTVRKDIYRDVKDLTSKRLTKNFRKRLEEVFENSTFIFDEGELTNLDELIEEAI